jgi:hypothetical protein
MCETTLLISYYISFFSFDAQDVGALIFSDQFLQLSALLPSSYIYGLGEHRSTLLLSMQWQRFTMFNHDHEPEENVSKSLRLVHRTALEVPFNLYTCLTSAVWI